MALFVGCFERIILQHRSMFFLMAEETFLGSEEEDEDEEDKTSPQ